MHIGFITSHFPFYDSDSVGGIGTSIKNLCDELVKLENQVSVFVYGQENDEIITDGLLTIYKIKNIKFKGLSWFLSRKKIQRIINSKNLDIIEVPDWGGISSFINSKAPLVIRLNGSDAYFCFLEFRKVKYINKFHEKKALLNADGIISVSYFTGKLTNQIFEINKDFTVIPNGIDIDNFFSESIENEQQTILYFGGIIRKKGLLEIPHYFNIVNNKYPNVKLILIGKDMTDKLSGRSSTLQMMFELLSPAAKENTNFLGTVPYRDIKKHIATATVCVFPSYAEALPLSWLEAMALEKAIVASNIGWSNELIVDGYNGYKVNPKSHKEFANKIMALIEDIELRNNMGRAARQTIVEKFSTKYTAIKTLDFYNKIIANKNA